MYRTIYEHFMNILQNYIRSKPTKQGQFKTSKRK